MLTNSVDKVYIRAAAVKKGACESRDRVDLGTARDTGGDLVSRRLSDWHGHCGADQRRRLDRITLGFHSNAIEEPVLEDLAIRNTRWPMSGYSKRCGRD
jgi:hypothetical protein